MTLIPAAHSPTLPPRSHLEPFLDQSTNRSRLHSSVRDAVLIGILLSSSSSCCSCASGEIRFVAGLSFQSLCLVTFIVLKDQSEFQPDEMGGSPCRRFGHRDAIWFLEKSFCTAMPGKNASRQFKAPCASLTVPLIGLHHYAHCRFLPSFPSLVLLGPSSETSPITMTVASRLRLLFFFILA